MPKPRADLQTLLVAILGSSNVYFQPPASVKMKYPAIVYSLDDVNTNFADDKPYSHAKRYSLTVIDQNPDSAIPDMIGMLQYSIFDRFFTADDLNHNVYKLFF